MKRDNPEERLHRACLQFILLAVPRSAMTVRHVPNGELRSARTAGRLKAMGVEAGTADLHCTLQGGRTGWIEIKSAKGRQSPEQRAFQAREEAIGALYAVVRSLDELEAVLRAWGVPVNVRSAA